MLQGRQLFFVSELLLIQSLLKLKLKNDEWDIFSHWVLEKVRKLSRKIRVSFIFALKFANNSGGFVF